VVLSDSSPEARRTKMSHHARHATSAILQLHANTQTTITQRRKMNLECQIIFFHRSANPNSARRRYTSSHHAQAERGQTSISATAPLQLLSVHATYFTRASYRSYYPAMAYQPMPSSEKPPRSRNHSPATTCSTHYRIQKPHP
jgi:hypothetical protein